MPPTESNPKLSSQAVIPDSYISKTLTERWNSKTIATSPPHQRKMTSASILRWCTNLPLRLLSTR